MSTVKKFLLGAVGLIITVSLIYIAFAVYDRTVRIANTVTQEQLDTEQELLEHGITKYEGYEINGATAITYIKSIIETYDGILIEVKTEKKSYEVVDNSKYGEFRNINSEYYINPMSFYCVMVERDENGTIIKVSLTYVS